MQNGRLLGYTLSCERPLLLGRNYASTTQLCHRKEGLSTKIQPHEDKKHHAPREKCGLNSERKKESSRTTGSFPFCFEEFSANPNRMKNLAHPFPLNYSLYWT
jgi:hypothetical protein